MIKHETQVPQIAPLTRRHASLSLMLPLLAGTPLSSQAQVDFPNRPIRVIFGFAAGGGTDAVVRAICHRVAELLGQSIVVDNRPGANANIAGEAVARAPADGYTLLYNTSSIVLSPHLYARLGYDVGKDLVPLGLTANIPLVLAARANAPFSNMEQFVRYLKDNPGKLTYASSSPGNITHLAAVRVLQESGTEALHAPYKSEAPALSDLLGGHVDFYVGNANALIPLVRDKRLKGLAVTSAQRIASIPDVPTLAETVKPGLEFGAWSGFMAPAKTPADVRARIERALSQAMQDKALSDRIAATDAEPRWMPATAYGEFMKSELARWGSVIQAAGLKPS